MTAVLTTPIIGSETLESMIGTATARTERCVTGDLGSNDMALELRRRASQVKLGAHDACRNAFQTGSPREAGAPRAHQLAVLEHAEARESVLLISPTGGGKTLAGFLPSLIEISGRQEKGDGIHTLYISPLKALAVDIARNLEAPVAEMGLPVTIETRTGDTPHSKRQRQRQKPPDILITTPEQVSLLVADPHAAHMLKNLRTVILDELHAIVTSKRGVLLSLALSRVQSHAPDAIRIGLSATVADPDALRAWLVPIGQARPRRWCMGKSGARPDIRILASVERVPWSGHSALYAIPEIYDEIRKAKMTLIFVNTRSQAEVIFQSLWEANDDNLPIALHHGSLDVGQRRKVEAAMGEGRLRAVVCTSTLELGIDWGDVDLVIHVGAPKGSSRLLQRIGRSNHKLDLPSQALLVPSNRFEVLECQAALHAAQENAQDTEYPMVRKLDVLAQHILGRACAGPFHAGDLFAEVTSAWTYRNLSREDFDTAVDFVATGGYALKAYERYAKLRLQPDGTLRLSHPRLAMAYRLNMGTIVEDEMLKVRLAHVKRRLGKRVVVGGRVLGEVEEWFISQLTTGTTFLFAGEVLRFEGLDEFGALASRSNDREPMVPSYQGGKFPLSTYLASACARCCRTRASGTPCRRRCVHGCRCRSSARWCRRRTRCWSRPSRAPTSTTWCATPSRAASRTRRWACC